MDWVAYLAKQGYTGRRATGAEVAYPCFFDCDEPADSKKRKLYVNSDTGLYSCKVCVSEGNFVQLMRHFGDEPERDHTPENGRRSEVLECATTAGEQMLANNEDVLDYLLGPRRGLSPESIVRYRIGYAPRLWHLSDQLPEDKHFSVKDKLVAGILATSHNAAGEENGTYEYYLDRVLIPYLENGRVVQLRGKDIFGRYYTPIGDPVHLFNVDMLRGATEAVLVEGEFDTMMLAEHLATSSIERIRNMAVIGLAGTGAIPDDFTARLAHLRRVFIATDPDEAGRKAAEKLKERLGDRAVVAEWPKALTYRWVSEGGDLKDLDWTTWIHKIGATVEEVEEMLRPRGRLKTLMQAFLSHRGQPKDGLKLGYRQLDAAFLPGLLPGQVMVMLAKTGVGKTVLLCNLCYNLRDKNVLFITLEMTAEEIWTRLARIYRFYNPFTTDQTIAAAFPKLRICDANRLDETAFRALVEEYTDEVGHPDVCLIDYLGYYARGFKGGSRYEKTSDAIMQLKSEAKSHRFPIITPAQVNRGAEEGKPLDADDARDSGAIEESADLLVGVWRTDDALDVNKGIPNGKLKLKILKSRHGNKDREVWLQMGLMSLVLLDDTHELSQRAHKETLATFRGETYDEWLAGVRNADPILTGADHVHS